MSAGTGAPVTPVEVGVDATTWWNDRGFGRFTREMVRALAGRGAGFRYTLVVDRPADATLPAGVRVLPVHAARTVTESAVQAGSRSPGDLWRLRRAVARQRFDLFFFPAVYSYVPLLAGLPVVVAFHDTIAERYPDLVFPTRRNRWLWRAKVWAARHEARRVMTVSQASARDLVDVLGIAPGRIDVVSEAADARFLRLEDPEPARAARARHGVPAGAPLLVYVGGLNPHKNLLALLGALELAIARHPEVHLAIVGDTSGKGFHDNAAELQRHVAERPALRERVRFTGWVADDQLVALYNGATALVLPSFWEGFGLPAVEAMACGLPVLASRRGSLPEVVGDAGLFFDPDSREDMAAAIGRLLGDGEIRAELAARARARAATFTWERGAELAEACFRRCLGSG